MASPVLGLESWFLAAEFCGEKFSSIYLEDHPRTDGYVLNNHGDRVRPRRIGLFPFQMG